VVYRGEQAILEGGADLVVTSRVPPGYLSDWLLDVEFVAVARPDHALFQIERELTRMIWFDMCKPSCGTRHVHPRDEGWLARTPFYVSIWSVVGDHIGRTGLCLAAEHMLTSNAGGA